MRFKMQIIYYLIVLKISKRFYKSSIEKLQEKRFRKLRHVLAYSPFYHDLSDKLNEPAKYPAMNKALFMDAFDQINTKGIKFEEANQIVLQSESSRDFSSTIGEITVGLSSGTSGNRGIFLASNLERAKWVAAVLDRVIGFTFRKRKVAFFLRANSNLYEAVQSSILSFHFLDILGDYKKNLNELHKIQPNILVAQPSMLIEIAKAQEQGLISIQPEKVISVAEVLTAEDKEYLSRVFDQTIHQVYQCTEGFLASTCKNGVLHFNEDFIHIDKKFIDEEQVKFHPVITDLWRESQPMINYELNDIVTLKSNCSCGSKMMAIETIEGRSDDVFDFLNTEGKAVKFFPDALRRAVILADEKIQDYSVILKKVDTVGLYIVGDKTSYTRAETNLKNLFSKNGLNNIKIYQIEESPFISGDKKRRIKNEYSKVN